MAAGCLHFHEPDSDKSLFAALFAGTELPYDTWVQVDLHGADRGGRACSTNTGSLMAPLNAFPMQINLH